jgi:hypothetical protein
MIQLKGTYILPNWDVEFTDPTITEITASDNINQKVCDVSVMLEVQGAKTTYALSVGKYEYQDTWQDEDIENFVKNQMETYKQ